LRTLALIVGGPTDFKIFHPQTDNLDKCTLISMSNWCFEAAEIDLENHKETKFVGTTSELLEKFKGTEDTQIFFLPFVENISGYGADTRNYIRYVLHVMDFNYN
jgi:hypothetical protein